MIMFSRNIISRLPAEKWIWRMKIAATMSLTAAMVNLHSMSIIMLIYK